MLNQEPFHSPKLRVLAISPALLPGGAEQHLTTLIRHAKTIKYVGIISINHYGNPIPAVLAETVSMACPHHAIYIEEGETPPAAINRGVSSITAGYDVILYWGLADLDLRWTKRPVIHISHASGVEKANKTHFDFVLRTGASNANFHVAVCRSGITSFARDVQELGDIQVIHNGADVERSRPIHGREWQRNRWGISDQDKLLLYVGRFYDGKGADVALQSLSYLPDNYKICLHGWGSQADQLRSMAQAFKGRVIFPQPRFHGLGDVYAAADMVVIPSASEAFPLVLVEAWQSACPVVCSDFSTLRECEEVYTGGMELAWHIPCPPSPRELADAVLQVDPADPRVMRALQVGLTSLTASAMVGRWEAFMYDCMRQWHDQGRLGIVETI